MTVIDLKSHLDSGYFNLKSIKGIAGKRYLNMQTEIENENESANSKKKNLQKKR